MYTDNEQSNSRSGLAVAASHAGFDPRPESLILPEGQLALVHETVLDLDQWLDGMRVPGGFGGPALHWWGESLDYLGPGLDWRYEGIIIGYLNLWHATSNPAWIEKARLAGNDLLAGQMASGNFRNSGFEANPNTGVTPHETAASLGLLKLALALHSLNDTTWSQYFQAAQMNIRDYHVQVLWDDRAQVFLDGPSYPTVSPDRLATLTEALFILSRLSGDSIWIDKYGIACLEAILSHQVKKGNLAGAIHVRSGQKMMEDRFFPILVARCLPALMLGCAALNEGRFAEAAYRAGNFLVQACYPDGSFPQVIYADGGATRWPAWVAPVGELVRVLLQVEPLGVAFDAVPSLHWILEGRLESGAIRSGIGFGRALLPPRRNDPRDQVPCCGWVDKAFRLLASIVDPLKFEGHWLKRMEAL